MTPEVFSWDDASDNRFLASGIAGWIHDAISAYRTTESTNPTVFKNTFIAHRAGGAGRQAGAACRRRSSSWRGSSRRTRQARQGVPDRLVDNDKEGMIAEHRLQHALPERQRQEADADHRRGPEAAGPPGLPEDRGFFGYPGPYTPQIQEVANSSSCCPTSSRGSRAGQSVDDSLKWGSASTAGSSPSTRRA